MVHPKRVELVKLQGIGTSYFGKILKNRLDVSKLGQGALVSPDFRDALVDLNNQVKQSGGTFYITELYRDWLTQEKARWEYVTGKKPFVAKPGESFHGSGRAIDLDIQNLNFPLPKQDWLKKLWELALPIGFRPVIDKPEMNKSEAWHLDFPGPWGNVILKSGYSEAAKCAVLDVGQWNPQEPIDKVQRMFIQAQLVRLGHEIGSVDGLIGKKTMAALQQYDFEDLTHLDAIIQRLNSK